MTETTRIRWEDDGNGGFEGRAGTLGTWLFDLWRSPGDAGDIIIGEWILSTNLPAPPGWRTPHGTDPEPLKAEAERWLEEFVGSLGAIFFEPAKCAEMANATWPWPSPRSYSAGQSPAPSTGKETGR